MSDQPKPTGEWTEEWVNELESHCDSIPEFVHRLVQIHNTALAAEREEFQRQLNAYRELYEPMAQKVKPLVDALTLVRRALCSGGGLREATDIIDDALAKVKEGK